MDHGQICNCRVCRMHKPLITPDMETKDVIVAAGFCAAGILEAHGLTCDDYVKKLENDPFVLASFLFAVSSTLEACNPAAFITNDPEYFIHVIRDGIKMYIRKQKQNGAISGHKGVSNG